MLLAWTDLETTGSDREKDTIIEVGIVLTDENLDVKDERSWLIRPPDIMTAIERIGSVNAVRDMHSKNGLVTDLLFKSRMTVESVESQITNWMDPHRQAYAKDDRGNRAILCGSGVGHFDKAFLLKHMPYLMRGFVHFVIDVGVIRRGVEMYAPKLAEASQEHYAALRADGKTHRALEDAQLHLEEMRFYRAYLFDGIQHLMERAA